MQMLIDSPEIRKELIRLRTYAIDNINDFTEGIPENYIPCGENSNHVYFNGTLKIVYSMERQKMNNGSIVLVHHLSVSSKGQTYPNPILVDHILKMFKMSDLNNKEVKREVWLEDGYALNIAEIIED